MGADQLDADELSTVLQHKYDPTPIAEVSFVLVVVEGPDAGARFAIESGCVTRLLLGSSPACAFRLTDREVSRRHAAFEWVDGRLRITDLGSRNGTFVDHVA